MRPHISSLSLSIKAVEHLLSSGIPSSSILVICSDWKVARGLEHVLDVRQAKLGTLYDLSVCSSGELGNIVIRRALPRLKLPDVLDYAEAESLMRSSYSELPLRDLRPPRQPFRYLYEVHSALRRLSMHGFAMPNEAALDSALLGGFQPHPAPAAAGGASARRREDGKEGGRMQLLFAENDMRQDALLRSAVAWQRIKREHGVMEASDLATTLLAAARSQTIEAEKMPVGSGGHALISAVDMSSKMEHLSGLVRKVWSHVICVDTHFFPGHTLSVLEAICGGGRRNLSGLHHSAAEHAVRKQSDSTAVSDALIEGLSPNGVTVAGDLTSTGSVVLIRDPLFCRREALDWMSSRRVSPLPSELSIFQPFSWQSSLRPLSMEDGVRDSADSLKSSSDVTEVDDNAPFSWSVLDSCDSSQTSRILDYAGKKLLLPAANKKGASVVSASSLKTQRKSGKQVTKESAIHSNSATVGMRADDGSRLSSTLVTFLPHEKDARKGEGRESPSAAFSSAVASISYVQSLHSKKVDSPVVNRTSPSDVVLDPALAAEERNEGMRHKNEGVEDGFFHVVGSRAGTDQIQLAVDLTLEVLQNSWAKKKKIAPPTFPHPHPYDSFDRIISDLSGSSDQSLCIVVKTRAEALQYSARLQNALERADLERTGLQSVGNGAANVAVGSNNQKPISSSRIYRACILHPLHRMSLLDVEEVALSVAFLGALLVPRDTRHFYRLGSSDLYKVAPASFSPSSPSALRKYMTAAQKEGEGGIWGGVGFPPPSPFPLSPMASTSSAEEVSNPSSFLSDSTVEGSTPTSASSGEERLLRDLQSARFKLLKSNSIARVASDFLRSQVGLQKRLNEPTDAPSAFASACIERMLQTLVRVDKRRVPSASTPSAAVDDGDDGSKGGDSFQNNRFERIVRALSEEHVHLEQHPHLDAGSSRDRVAEGEEGEEGGPSHLTVLGNSPLHPLQLDGLSNAPSAPSAQSPPLHVFVTTLQEALRNAPGSSVSEEGQKSLFGATLFAGCFSDTSFPGPSSLRLADFPPPDSLSATGISHPLLFSMDDAPGDADEALYRKRMAFAQHLLMQVGRGAVFIVPTRDGGSSALSGRRSRFLEEIFQGTDDDKALSPPSASDGGASAVSSTKKSRVKTASTLLLDSPNDPPPSVPATASSSISETSLQPPPSAAGMNPSNATFLTSKSEKTGSIAESNNVGSSSAPPPSLSFSRIVAYKQCPYSVYLSHKLLLPSGGNAYMRVGRALHAGSAAMSALFQASFSRALPPLWKQVWDRIEEEEVAADRSLDGARLSRKIEIALIALTPPSFVASAPHVAASLKSSGVSIPLESLSASAASISLPPLELCVAAMLDAHDEVIDVQSAPTASVSDSAVSEAQSSGLNAKLRDKATPNKRREAPSFGDAETGVQWDELRETAEAMFRSQAGRELEAWRNWILHLKGEGEGREPPQSTSKVGGPSLVCHFPIAVEAKSSVTLGFGGVNFRSIIDRVDLKISASTSSSAVASGPAETVGGIYGYSSSLILRDLKTSPRQTETAENLRRHALQLQLYDCVIAALLSKRQGSIVSEASEQHAATATLASLQREGVIEYMRSDDTHHVNLSLIAEKEAALNLTRQVAKSINEQQFNPSPGFHCRSCSYKAACKYSMPGVALQQKQATAKDV